MRVSRSLSSLLLLLAIVACSRDRADDTPAPADGAAPAATSTADGPARDAPAVPAAPAAPPRIEDLVRADDTLATAQARLGADAVVPEHLPGAESESVSGWTLFPDDPARRLSVYLDESGENPMLVLAGREATAWTRADGVRIGLTSQELAQLNGGPFGFMGFEWDYGGVVTDWREGRLAPDGASAGPVTLCPPEAKDGEPLDYPMGDQEYRSDDARLLMHPATVCEFGVNIDPPAPAAGD